MCRLFVSPPFLLGGLLVTFWWVVVADMIHFLRGNPLDWGSGSLLFLVWVLEVSATTLVLFWLIEKGAYYERKSLLSGRNVETLDIIDEYNIKDGLQPTPLTWRNMFRWLLKSPGGVWLKFVKGFMSFGR